MKKLFTLVSLACLIASCNNGSNTNASADADSTIVEVEDTVVFDNPEDIEARVREIYDNFNDPDIYTSGFSALINKVREYDESTGAELGYIDHDILTQAQDVVDIRSISISDITETTAKATITTNFDPLTVQLVKENGVWCVDNVNDERERMQKYLK